MRISRGKVTKIAKPKALQRSEHDEQVALFQWAAIASAQHRELGLLFAVPNGARTSWSVAKRLKAEGLKSGVPDVILPVMRINYGGLFVEMKRANGVPSDSSREQKRWAEALAVQGYRVVTAYGFEQARAAILDYLNL